MYAKNASWAQDPEFRAAWSGFPEMDNLVHDRRFTLYGIAKAVAHVSGDMAECGVRFGRGAFIMLAATPAKHLYGFDSFDGLSEPSDEDRGTHWVKHDFASDEERAQRNLRGQNVTLLKGWIPERFSEVADKKFSLVHIDVDLYQPTRDSLEFFWPRLNAGGALVCDDYGSLGCPGAKLAVDEFADSIGRKAAPLATGQALLWR
jgi:O-methyltransferase